MVFNIDFSPLLGFNIFFVEEEVYDSFGPKQKEQYKIICPSLGANVHVFVFQHMGTLFGINLRGLVIHQGDLPLRFKLDCGFSGKFRVSFFTFKAAACLTGNMLSSSPAVVVMGLEEVRASRTIGVSISLELLMSGIGFIIVGTLRDNTSILSKTNQTLSKSFRQGISFHMVGDMWFEA